MDIATIFGLIVGWALTILAVVIGGYAPAGYWDLPSASLVIFGGFCAVVISVPIAALSRLPRVVMNSLFIMARDSDFTDPSNARGG